MNSERFLSRQRQSLIVPLIVALLATVTVTWMLSRDDANTDTSGSFDFMVYTDLEDLSAASDAVVIGTVGPVVGREVDFGTAEPDERVGDGIAVIFNEVEVLEVLRGRVADTIIVGGPDSDAIMSTDTTPLRIGERVVLFLAEQTTADAPGITAFGFFYTPVSLDNGVFDVVSDERIDPRMPEAFRTESVPSPSFTLQEIRSSVAGN